MKDMKNVHKSGGVRPIKMVKALAYFKDQGHEFYQDVIINRLFCSKEFLQNDKDVLGHIEHCHLTAQANEEEIDLELRNTIKMTIQQMNQMRKSLHFHQ